MMKTIITHANEMECQIKTNSRNEAARSRSVVLHRFTFLVAVSVFELHTSRQACFMILFVGAQIQT